MKKLFAVLMSIMMIACFMPTMAFAVAVDYSGVLSAPSEFDNSVAGQITLTKVTLGEEDSTETLVYGYSKDANAQNDTITWGEENQVQFDGLEQGAEYYFFTKLVASEKYNESISQASSAVKVKSIPNCDIPTSLSATYGDKLSGVVLPTVDNSEVGKTPGTWSWSTEYDRENTTVGNKGDNQFKAVFTPQDLSSYASKTEMLTVKVNPASYEYAPTIADTLYVGNPYPAGGPVKGTGVNADKVDGTLAWFTNAECTTPVPEDEKIAASESPITLYWKFTTTNANYTPMEKTESKEFTVTKKEEVTVTFGNAESKPYITEGYTLGTQFKAASVEGKDASNIHYVYNGGEKKSNLADLTEQVTNAGQYSVTAIYDDETSHGETTATFEITKANQDSLTLNAEHEMTYGGELTLSAEGGTTNGSIQYQVVTGGTATGTAAITEGGKLKATKVGTVKVKAVMEGNGNYNPVESDPIEITINAKTLAVSFEVKNKEYDGTMSAEIKGTPALSEDDIVPNDVVALNTDEAVATFADANVGTGKTVTLSGAKLTGEAAGNYSIASQLQTQADITAKSITATAVITLDANPTYNGAEQTITIESVKVGNTTLTANQDYEVTSGQSATNVGAVTLTLSGKGNYTGTATKGWSILQKQVTLSGQAADRAYEKDNKAVTVTLTPEGIVDGDKSNVTLNTKGITGKIATADAGTSKPVTIEGTAKLEGTAAANYTLGALPTDVTVNITKTAHTPVTYPVKVKQGATAKYELKSIETLNLKDYNLSNPVITAGEALLETTPAVTLNDDGTLTFKVKNDAVVGGKATIKITAAESANYNAFDVIVEVTVEKKTSSSGSSGGGGGSSVTPTTPSQDVKTDTKTGTTTVATDVKVSEKTNADGTKEKVAEVKVSAAKQKEILKQAKAGKSKDIVLSVSKSEVRDAGKADVTLDKSFIESIANDTDAKLTIQTPFGEKTYTKEELKKLAAEATGSTITMTIEPAADDSAAKIEKAKEIVADMQLVARSSKTAKKSVKVVLKTDDATKASIEELKALGFKVEYKFYRSTKKAASYKAGATKGDASYTNTVGKKGTKYFYKVRVVVSNGDGVVVQTALKQCKYASRTWTK